MVYFVVSSMREYADEEIYYGADAVFTSQQDALDYFVKQITDTFSIDHAHVTEVLDGGWRFTSWDECEYCMKSWQIDAVEMK